MMPRLVRRENFTGDSSNSFCVDAVLMRFLLKTTTGCVQIRYEHEDAGGNPVVSFRPRDGRASFSPFRCGAVSGLRRRLRWWWSVPACGLRWRSLRRRTLLQRARQWWGLCFACGDVDAVRPHVDVVRCDFLPAYVVLDRDLPRMPA